MTNYEYIIKMKRGLFVNSHVSQLSEVSKSDTWTTF